MANDRNAGRKPNNFKSRKVSVPDPIREEVVLLINNWKLKQNDRKNGK